MTGKTTPWEQIVAIAKRIESRVGARRPIEPQMGLDLVRAILSFDALMSQWRTHLSGVPDEGAVEPVEPLLSGDYGQED
jgi:hypothetical protein